VIKFYKRERKFKCVWELSPKRRSNELYKPQNDVVKVITLLFLDALLS